MTAREIDVIVKRLDEIAADNLQWRKEQRDDMHEIKRDVKEVKTEVKYTNGRVTSLERESAEDRAVQADHAARETIDRQRNAWFWPMLVGSSIALATLIVFLIAYHLI